VEGKKREAPEGTGERENRTDEKRHLVTCGRGGGGGKRLLLGGKGGRKKICQFE